MPEAGLIYDKFCCLGFLCLASSVTLVSYFPGSRGLQNTNRFMNERGDQREPTEWPGKLSQIHGWFGSSPTLIP